MHMALIMIRYHAAMALHSLFTCTGTLPDTDLLGSMGQIKKGSASPWTWLGKGYVK